MSNQRLKEAFQEVDSRTQDELHFDDFSALYNILIYDDNVRLLLIIIVPT